MNLSEHRKIEARTSTSARVVRFAGMALLFAVCACRPSQQTRKADTHDLRNGGAGGEKAMDSLLRVQYHLVDLIDTMSVTLEQDRDRIRNLEVEVARLRSMLEQQKVAAVSKVPLPPSSEQRTYTAPPVPGTGSAQLPSMSSGSQYSDKYSRALQYFNEARYQDAYNAFDELTSLDPNSTYTPNYLYWRGESSYALGDYSGALAGFKTVLDRYPSCSKADDAAFKIGECYEKLGNKAAAKTAYQRLLAVYPNTEYRTRVETRLKRLQSSP